MSDAEARNAAIAAGIPAADVDRLFGDGLVIVDEPARRVIVRVVVDGPGDAA